LISSLLRVGRMPKHATASAKAERITAPSAATGATGAGGANVGSPSCACGSSDLSLEQRVGGRIVLNHAWEQMGLASTQTLGPILDGLMRNTPDALRFIGLAAREGVGAVIAERDGPFADYSQGPPEEQPDPAHVIHPPPR